MSYTFTLSGKSSVLSDDFNPPIYLNDGEYEIGLANFDTFNNIPNIDEKNNVLVWGKNNEFRYEIPVGAYEISDIIKIIEREMFQIAIITTQITPDERTSKVTIKSTEWINFEVDHSIGSLFGFTKIKLEPNIIHSSVYSINILKVNTICIDTNIAIGSFLNGLPFSDNTIEDYQFHSYQPFTFSNFNYNDEIRIPIQDLEAYTFPSNSYLYIEGRILTDQKKVPTKFNFINNGIAYLFRELRLWSGFFEDFRKIVMNMRQELVLIREKADIDGVIATDDTKKPKIDIIKVCWNVPHITPSIKEQIRLNKIIRSNVDLPLMFRSWELIEYPALSNATRHTWPVKTTTKIESPRHIVVAFQNARKGKLLKDMSKFDHLNLTNIRAFLNSERYPYQDLHLDFNTDRFATLYEMFANFQESYYHIQTNQPIFTPEEFKNNAPIVHIDCSRQKEILQSGSVVLRIEFETDNNVGNEVSAYCLILHEKEFSYNPLTKIVKQI
ncbi:unnamed protein product [Psylliodes chrysocephalus]|uniref:Double jelly roll-like domain-containing protein n=1 Tax=Psylliodes chrysocephalus TaxID=3402493 RepID=A0A9P0CJD2_9CUCU|nr:unnamed protein product [Psylliodes chrysocephala]